MQATASRGGTFIERYSLRDGVRVSGLGRAELVNPASGEPRLTEARRQTQHIDVLYREWLKQRTDVDCADYILRSASAWKRLRLTPEYSTPDAPQQRASILVGTAHIA
jgi:hypothetical protein